MPGRDYYRDDRPTKDQRLLKVMLIAFGSALAAGGLVLTLPLIRTVGPSGRLEYAPPIETAGFRTILTNLSPAIVSLIALMLRRWRWVRLLASLVLVFYTLLGLAFLVGVFFIPAAVLQVVAVFLPYPPGDRRPQAPPINGT